MDLEDRIKAFFKSGKIPTKEEIDSGTYPPIAEIQATFDRYSPEPYTGSRKKWDQYALGENMESRQLAKLARQFVEQNPSFKKDISIPDWVNQRSPDDLMANALKNNDGISIGDIHPSKNLHTWIESKMQFFENHGVKAVGFEQPGDLRPQFEELNKLPTVEAKLHKLEEIYGQQNPDFNSSSVERLERRTADQPQQDDRGMYDMMRSAIQHHMLICIKDSTAHEEDKQVDSLGRGHNLRINETNFTWAREIDNFRKNHNFGPGDKFVDIGGEAHYDNSEGGHVDEITGFPSFKLRPKDATGLNNFTENHDNTTDYTIQIPDPGNELASLVKSMNPTDVRNNPPDDEPGQTRNQTQPSR